MRSPQTRSRSNTSRLASLRKLLTTSGTAQVIQQMSPTTADDIIAALESRYTPRLSWDERQILLTDSDVKKWSREVGLPSGVLYDALALKLALGFNSNMLDFGFCDQVVNELH